MGTVLGLFSVFVQVFWKYASQLKQDNEQDSGHNENRGHTSNGAL